MKLTERQQERLTEIEALVTTIAADSDDTDPEILLVAVNGEDADRIGVYPMLWVTPEGTVAEATVDNPIYYGSLDELMAVHR